MGWCFAIINSRLAEIYFEKYRGKIKILGHAYVKKEKYKTKKEQRYKKEDTLRFHFRYRKGIYKDLLKSNQFFETLQGSL